VKIPEQFEASSVWLRKAETMSSIRRDFRIIRLENEHTEPCVWPWIKLPFGWNLRGGDCLQLTFWDRTKLYESKEEKGVYSIMPPEPSKKGHWTGYYIHVYFKGDTE